jgi:hypothetical protein
MDTNITLTQLEAAINFWRQTKPSQGDELRLCDEASALAEPYAMLIMTKRTTLAVDQLDSAAQLAIGQWASAQKLR